MVGQEHEPLAIGRDRRRRFRPAVVCEERRDRLIRPQPSIGRAPCAQIAGGESGAEPGGEHGDQRNWHHPTRALLERRRRVSERVADVAESPLRVLLETAREQMENARGNARGNSDHSRFRVRIAARKSETVVAGEGLPPGQHLEEHAAERPDVRPLVDRLTARLLGTHVGGGTEDDARRRVPSPDIVGEFASVSRRHGVAPSTAFARPKSSTFDDAVGGDLDVGRLQIAMDDARARARPRAPRRSGARCPAPRERQRARARSDRRASALRRAPSRAQASRRIPRSRRSRAMFG